MDTHGSGSTSIVVGLYVWPHMVVGIHVWTHGCGDTGIVVRVHVWTHRGWGGYMYGHREGEVDTCMDTERVRWVHV